MVDIHSHLIYGVDDGPAAIKESIRMVLEAEKLGIKAIIATPHSNGNLYNIDMALSNFRELKNRTVGCGVELFMGCEAFFNPDIPDSVKGKKTLTLNRSGYLLMELPFDTIPAYGYETIYKLNIENIIPVIAHPERNRRFIRDFGAFISFVEKGCLVQLDAASIIGVYGTEVKSFARKLVKLNLVNFVASDAHCAGDYTEWLPAAYKKVARWSGQENADRLFNTNPRIILEDSEVSAYKTDRTNTDGR